MTNRWEKWLFLGGRLQCMSNNLQKVLGSEKCPPDDIRSQKCGFYVQNATRERLEWFRHCFDHFRTHWLRSRHFFQAHDVGRRKYVTLLPRPGKAAGSLEVAKLEKPQNPRF